VVFQTTLFTIAQAEALRYGVQSEPAGMEASARLHLPLARRSRQRLARGFMSTPSVPAELAVIKTSHGEMTVAFWPDVAPKTVENFKKLAREGFYDGTAFHRVIKGFMIQGGCPNTKAGATGTPGTGGPGWKLKAEFNEKPHARGVLSMARSAHPDSAGSQFFICHGAARFLDRQYTAFGEVVQGLDVLDRIANVPCTASGGERSQPVERIAVESIRLVPAA
jgi:peptidyl-prolyl cis-trans isomerase B (cyclophilin B)